MSPASVLIVGASRGLGRALAEHYVSLQSRVFATVRSPLKPDQQFKGRIQVIEGIDCSQSDVGKRIVDGLKGETVEIVVIVAGLLKPEEFGKSSFEDEVSMYKICAIAPVLIVEDLATSSSLSPNAKILLLTSEAGSVTLRTQGEGGGMYGHHGSKAAGNMVGKLLSLDLKDRGVPVAMIHPGFLKTEMTKDAGMEQFYEKMGAVTPEEACKPFAAFVEKLNMDMTGKLWAPSGFCCCLHSPLHCSHHHLP